MTTTPDSYSPEPEELLDIAIRYHTTDINVALPGKIDSYDAARQMANVKPLVQRLIETETGEELLESLPVIPGVPVVFPRGGNSFMSMPVEVGDHCLLVFNSFPIDKYKSGDGTDKSPDNFSMHELSDAVALMGFAPFSKSIADADVSNVVIGFDNGGNQLHISSTLIELGKKGAGDKLSLDSKLQAELSKISAELVKVQALLTALAPHTHLGNIGVPTGPPIPPIVPTISYSPTPTNSTLVTIKS